MLGRRSRNGLGSGKALTTICVITLSVLLFLPALSNAGKRSGVPIGIGSLPSRLAPDGTVCLTDPKNPTACVKKLMRLSRSVNGQDQLTFYGVFDVDHDGSPEVFVEYWPYWEEKDYVVLLVYKKVKGNYRVYAKCKAESIGHSPAAWFLDEPPHPKALFMTRYGGSSGDGLFYLNLKKKSLDLVSNGVLLVDNPIVADFDGDGMAEVFLPGRGYDRTARPGAAVLHWREDSYKIIWPDWPGVPNIIDATLADLFMDGKKEVVAVLEPEKNDDNSILTGSRQLGIWRFENKSLVPLTSADLKKVKDPRESDIGLPSILRISPSKGEGHIILSYDHDGDCKITDCHYGAERIICTDCRSNEQGKEEQ